MFSSDSAQRSRRHPSSGSPPTAERSSTRSLTQRSSPSVLLRRRTSSFKLPTTGVWFIPMNFRCKDSGMRSPGLCVLSRFSARTRNSLFSPPPATAPSRCRSLPGRRFSFGDRLARNRTTVPVASRRRKKGWGKRDPGQRSNAPLGRVLCPQIRATPKERRSSSLPSGILAATSSPAPSAGPPRYSPRTTRAAVRSPGLHSTTPPTRSSRA